LLNRLARAHFIFAPTIVIVYDLCEIVFSFEDRHMLLMSKSRIDNDTVIIFIISLARVAIGKNRDMLASRVPPSCDIFALNLQITDLVGVAHW
jgi:hypothetical protein